MPGHLFLQGASRSFVVGWPPSLYRPPVSPGLADIAQFVMPSALLPFLDDHGGGARSEVMVRWETHI